jgi:hypothetical protein
VVVTIEAPSFVYNQIRYMVGTGMAMASGALPEWLVDLALFNGQWSDLDSQKVSPVVLLPLAPAEGLALIDAHFSFGCGGSREAAAGEVGISSGGDSSACAEGASTPLTFSLSAPPSGDDVGSATDTDAKGGLALAMSSHIRTTAIHAMRLAMHTSHETHRRVASACASEAVGHMQRACPQTHLA